MIKHTKGYVLKSVVTLLKSVSFLKLIYSWDVLDIQNSSNYGGTHVKRNGNWNGTGTELERWTTDCKLVVSHPISIFFILKNQFFFDFDLYAKKPFTTVITVGKAFIVLFITIPKLLIFFTIIFTIVFTFTLVIIFNTFVYDDIIC